MLLSCGTIGSGDYRRFPDGQLFFSVFVFHFSVSMQSYFILVKWNYKKCTKSVVGWVGEGGGVNLAILKDKNCNRVFCCLIVHELNNLDFQRQLF